MIQEDIKNTKIELERLVVDYSKYQNLKPDVAPKFVTYWAPSSGVIEVVSDRWFPFEYNSLKVVLGITMGGRFAQNDEVTRSEFTKKVKQALMQLVQKHGGFCCDKYGSNYTVIGFVKE